MPDGGAFVAALFFTKGTFAFKVVAFAVNVAVAVGLSYATSTLFAPKFGESINGRTEMTREPAHPKRFIFGKCKVSGNVTYAHTTGDKAANDNGFLHYILCLAGHEIESVTDIKFADKPLNLVAQTPDTNGVVPYVPGAGNEFEGKVRIKIYYGTDDQPADAQLISETSAGNGNWTSEHQGKRIAYLYVRLQWDQDVFPQGWPILTCVVEGWKRTGIQIYTRNPIVLLREYLTFPADFGGGGFSPENIVTSVYEASRDTCDEDVDSYSGGPLQKRYFCDFTSLASEKKGEIIQRFLSSCAGWIDWDGGKWLLNAGAYSNNFITIDDGDIIGPVQCKARDSVRDTANGIKGIYLAPENDYNTAEFKPYLARAKVPSSAHTIDTGANTFTQSGPELVNGDRVSIFFFPTGSIPGGVDLGVWYYVVNADASTFQISETEGGTAVNLTSAGSNVYTHFDPFITEDGERIWADLELETVSDPYLSQRLAKIQLLRMRNDFMLQLEVRMKAFQLRTGSLCRVKNNKLGLLGLTGDVETATMTGSSNTFNDTAHGFIDGDTIAPITITITGAAGDLLERQYYYVINATADTFQLSRRRGGPVLNIGDGSMGYQEAEGTLFECVSSTLVTRNQSDDGKGFVYVSIGLQETQEDLYDWDAGFVSEETFSPDTDLPNTRVVAAPAGLAQESGTNQLYANSDGTIISRMKLSWTPVPNQFVQSGGYYEIQFKLNSDADTEWEDASPPTAVGSASFVHLLGLQDGEFYDLRIRAVNTVGTSSPYATITNQEMIGKTEPPGPVTNVNYTERRGSIEFTWDDPTDLDLRHIEIRAAITNDSSGDPLVGPAVSYKIAEINKGSQLYRFNQRDISFPMDSNLFGAQVSAYEFYFRAVDTTGNKSSFVIAENTASGGIRITRPTNHQNIRADSPRYNVIAVNTGSDIFETDLPHGFRQNEPVLISSTGTLPGGISANTVYYIIQVGGEEFQLASTIDGSAINITSAGSGTIKVTSTRIGLFFDPSDDPFYVSSSAIVGFTFVGGTPIEIPLSRFSERNTQSPLLMANQIIFARGLSDGSGGRFIIMSLVDSFGVRATENVSINYVERTPFQP